MKFLGKLRGINRNTDNGIKSDPLADNNTTNGRKITSGILKTVGMATFLLGTTLGVFGCGGSRVREYGGEDVVEGEDTQQCQTLNDIQVNCNCNCNCQFPDSGNTGEDVVSPKDVPIDQIKDLIDAGAHDAGDGGSADAGDGGPLPDIPDVVDAAQDAGDGASQDAGDGTAIDVDDDPNLDVIDASEDAGDGYTVDVSEEDIYFETDTTFADSIGDTEQDVADSTDVMLDVGQDIGEDVQPDVYGGPMEFCTTVSVYYEGDPVEVPEGYAHEIILDSSFDYSLVADPELLAFYEGACGEETGEQLNYAIEYWNDQNGESKIWVRTSTSQNLSDDLDSFEISMRYQGGESSSLQGSNIFLAYDQFEDVDTSLDMWSFDGCAVCSIANGYIDLSTDEHRSYRLIFNGETPQTGYFEANVYYNPAVFGLEDTFLMGYLINYGIHLPYCNGATFAYYSHGNPSWVNHCDVPELTEGWHVWAIQVQTDIVKAYVDGEVFASTTRGSDPSEIWIGVPWGGETARPTGQQKYVDWVLIKNILNGNGNLIYVVGQAQEFPVMPMPETVQ